MNKEFTKVLSEILEIPQDKISSKTKLPEDLWDSLALLAIAAAIDSAYDKVVPVKLIEKCTSVQDLLDLAEGND